MIIFPVPVTKTFQKSTRIVRGGALNQNMLREAVKNTDMVFRLAVKPLEMSFDGPDEVVRANDYGTCRKSHLSDISKAKRRLGYRLKIKLEDEIQSRISWRLKKRLVKLAGTIA